METPVGSAQEWQAIITAFIQDHVRRAGANGVVIGLSGGLDSAVVAALATAALGKKAVMPILMPSDLSHANDARDALLVATHLGLKPREIPVGNIVAAVADTVDIDDDQRRGNAMARARMLILYAEAQRLGRLVCGTGNKSELLVGYFSKHGDGGVDLQPIGDLYKTQVRELATVLGLPQAVIDKAPSAGLWAGQSDEAELGMPYSELDAILKGIELNASVGDIAARTGLPQEQVKKVEGMVRRTEHKRRPPLIPKIGARTVGIDWRRSVHWDG